MTTPTDMKHRTIPAGRREISLCETVTDQYRCDGIFEQFQNLEKAVADASSIIYIKKAGFLEDLAQVLTLYSPEEIIRETGFMDLPVQPAQPAQAPRVKMVNDDRLLAVALDRELPVISEDKKILTKARKSGLPFFNALMMLHFLLFKKAIKPEKHAACRQKLIACAWYNASVLKVAQAVFDHIRNGEIQ